MLLSQGRKQAGLCNQKSGKIMTITIYSRPSCVQCKATYKALDNKHISYDIVDISKDAEALSYIESLGYKMLPVVIAGNNHWAGFQPDKINGLE